MALPRVVSPAEWQVARDELLVREKEATRALDALAAERRRLPMVEFQADHELEGPDGRVRLRTLFHERRQLIVYHFMLAPGEAPCVGCSAFVDNVAHLARLRARDTSFVLVSPAPFAEIEPFKPAVRLQPPGPDAAWPPGRLGGLARRLAADARVHLVAPARRVPRPPRGERMTTLPEDMRALPASRTRCAGTGWCS